MHPHKHSHMHAPTQTLPHACIHTNTPTCMHPHKHTPTCMHPHMHICGHHTVTHTGAIKQLMALSSTHSATPVPPAYHRHPQQFPHQSRLLTTDIPNSFHTSPACLPPTCLCTYMQACTHPHVYKQACTHSCVHVCKHIHPHACVHVCNHAHNTMYSSMHTHTSVHVCKHAHTPTCMCTCLQACTHTHA